MHISARADYAVRAMVTAASYPDGPVKAAKLAEDQDIPLSFLHGILLDLRRAGLMFSQRGGGGGYALARPAGEISVGDILRTLQGSLSTVRGMPSQQVAYEGVAAGLPELWRSIEAAIAEVVDRATLTDVLVGQRSPVDLPPPPS
ncbi:BadM/Rrf2 family transcriptional regulator [Micromonospora violae]|uniref:BadM/Rrf2 family transcriptional regulator n=1 Tax=Micromonospora violae TaxID=1278207 RepID=A0A4Q7UEI5_9ACTN|nr:Rrf2 family transcriptional regulator [Micromonospora violae]RZT79687.1 BadM/Rrf2 family transcriptional regulator [Micromonospora violae]